MWKVARVGVEMLSGDMARSVDSQHQVRVQRGKFEIDISHTREIFRRRANVVGQGRAVEYHSSSTSLA